MAMRVTPLTPIVPCPIPPGQVPVDLGDPVFPLNAHHGVEPEPPPRHLRPDSNWVTPHSPDSPNAGPTVLAPAETDKFSEIGMTAKKSFFTPTRSLPATDSDESTATDSATAATGSRKRHAVVQTVAKPKSNVEPCLNKTSRLIVEHRYVSALTTMLTVYALIGDDLRLLLTNMPSDDYFNILTLICLVVFLLEILLSSLGKNDYFGGFFFVLDVVSTLTLIMDLTWIAEVMLGGEGADKLRSGRTARIGAKAGRVVRVIRLVRIIKLWKAIQDAKAEKKRREDALARGEEVDDDDWGEEDEAKKAKDGESKESRVGKKLSEMTTRRVIILVLTMLLALPFMQTDQNNAPPGTPWFAADNVYELFLEWNSTREADSQLRYERAVLKYLYYHNWFTGNVADWVPETELSPRGFQQHVFWVGIMSKEEDILHEPYWLNATKLRPSTVADFEQEVDLKQNEYIYRFGTMPAPVRPLISSTWRYECKIPSKDIYRLGFSLLANQIEDKVSYVAPCPEDLRFTEKFQYYPRSLTMGEYEKWHFAFYFDMRPFSRQGAIYGLCTTAFICLVLCVASLYFSSDANRLVLRPVEQMVKRVEMIRDNPLIAVKMADEEFKKEEREKARLKHVSKTTQMLRGCWQAVSCSSKGAHEPMETVILEKTIIKLGSLLALGFGEAGANIIGHNLSSSDSAGVNAMIPGTRVECILGLARIGDFSTATEVLKAKVMTFVNQIAEIVHGVVSEFHGAANKNNGDTFVLIWRCLGLEEEGVSRMADMSTIAFAKILGALHRSATLASYRGHPALQQRLGGKCRVCVTMGLHSGWAIEGAVGSEFKIDASYLSPNVSIALQVEQATAIYTVPILVTEQVKILCCPDIAKKYRKIDKVVIRGSSEPMFLFTLDLDYMCLHVDNDMSTRPPVFGPRQRFKARQFLEVEKARKLDPEVKTLTVFEQCSDIAAMRRRYSVEFEELFNMGFQNYMEGEWQIARQMLNKTQTMLRLGGSLHLKDGPSSALLLFMERSNFEPPSGWIGVHDLIL